MACESENLVKDRHGAIVQMGFQRMMAFCTLWVYQSSIPALLTFTHLHPLLNLVHDVLRV